MTRDPSELIKINLRIREGLRAQLEAAAAGSGQSINGEMASRLAASFVWDEVAGSPETLTLVRRLASNIDHTEKAFGGKWSENFTTFNFVREQAAKALDLQFEYMKPKVPDEDYLRQLLQRRQSVMAQLAEVESVLVQAGQGPSRSGDLAGWVPKLDCLTEDQRRDIAPIFGRQYALLDEISRLTDEARAALRLATETALSTGEPVSEALRDLASELVAPAAQPVD